jgi:hypothetical protein
MNNGPLITQITLIITDYAYLSLIFYIYYLLYILSLTIYPFSSIYLSIYSYLSYIPLSLIHSYPSPIPPASIRHRPRQAEYRHAAALRARRARHAMARTAAA